MFCDSDLTTRRGPTAHLSTLSNEAERERRWKQDGTPCCVPASRLHLDPVVDSWRAYATHKKAGDVTFYLTNTNSIHPRKDDWSACVCVRVCACVCALLVSAITILCEGWLLACSHLPEVRLRRKRRDGEPIDFHDVFKEHRQRVPSTVHR